MTRKNNKQIEHEDSSGYMMSISDLMSGLVFIFIIALVYFVVHFKSVNKSLASRNETRTQILTEIEHRIKEKDLDKNLEIEVNAKNGVIHIRDKSDKMLFRRGKAEPEDNGRIVLKGLSDLLREIVPCYTPSNFQACGLPVSQQPSPIDRKLETIFIEGHTDRYPIHNAQFSDNWELSVQRAIEVYRVLVDKNNYLEQIKNESGFPVFSVSGYGATRPISKENDFEKYMLDRRIDLRFIMTPPKDGEVGELNNEQSTLKINLSPK